MAITARKRKSLKSSQFGFPSQHKYPVDTVRRAANAKARASAQAKKGKLSAGQKAQIDRAANRKLYGSAKAPRGRK